MVSLRCSQYMQQPSQLFKNDNRTSERVTIYASWTLTNGAQNKVRLLLRNTAVAEEYFCKAALQLRAEQYQYANLECSETWTTSQSFFTWMDSLSRISCRLLTFLAKCILISRRILKRGGEKMTSVKDDGLTSNEKNNEHFSSTIFISLERPNISQICSICKVQKKQNLHLQPRICMGKCSIKKVANRNKIGNEQIRENATKLGVLKRSKLV